MAWSNVAGAAISIGGAYLSKKSGGGGGGNGSPVTAADPFADQRSQYQGMLAQLMGAPGASSSGGAPSPSGGGGGGGGGFGGGIKADFKSMLNPAGGGSAGIFGLLGMPGVGTHMPGLSRGSISGASASPRFGGQVPPGMDNSGLPQPTPSSASAPLSTNGDPMARDAMTNLAFANHKDSQNLFHDLTGMMTPGSDFQSSDPSYQFRLQSGMDSVNRGMAKSGGLGSGNQMVELMKYGQGMASQEFQNEFARKESAIATAGQLESQQFGELSQIDQNKQNIFQNNYARLAQLSGANSGQPGMAGQLLASQQAGAAAGWQQLGSAALGGIKSLWGSATAPDNYSGTTTGTLPGGGVDPSYAQYENTQAPTDPSMDW